MKVNKVVLKAQTASSLKPARKKLHVEKNIFLSNQSLECLSMQSWLIDSFLLFFDRTRTRRSVPSNANTYLQTMSELRKKNCGWS